MASESEKYVCTLSSDLIKKAEKELHEKAKWRDRDIQALRDLVNGVKGLNCPTDDTFLLRFLRGRKFDYERALQMLINYYKMREENKEILKELTPKAVEHLTTDGVSMILPNKDKHGRAIMYLRPSKWDPEKYLMLELIRINLMNLEMIIQEEEVQINGVVLIVNAADMTWNHAKNIDRNYARIMTGILQGAFPIRSKGINIVNEPSFFGYVFALVKPFLSEKMASRLTFYGSDIKALHKAVGKKNLPPELDGDLPPSEELAKDWKAKLEAAAPMFEESQKYSIELTHEISDRKGDENVSSLAGTYRKLTID